MVNQLMLNICHLHFKFFLYYEYDLLTEFWLVVTSKDFHTIGCVISVDPARKSLGYQGQSSRVNQDVLGSHDDLRCQRCQDVKLVVDRKRIFVFLPKAEREQMKNVCFCRNAEITEKKLFLPKTPFKQKETPSAGIFFWFCFISA